ncbi:MAG: ABC transporter permease [Candidatus Latescibacteria bacterium]|nr:ABC transporter permease [Candidatus Latescibacterota bacterium]
MNLLEPISMGIIQLRTNKLRSILSLLGILIAVGSVTGIVSLGEGLQSYILGEFDKMGGYSMIWSWAPDSWYRNESGNWVRRPWEEYLTYRDVEAIMAETNLVEYVIPHVWVNMGGTESNMQYRSASTYGSVESTSPYYIMEQNWRIAKGRFLNFFDMANKAKVCVLGSQLAEDLFGVSDPIEKEVKMGGMRYTVVGVMESKQFFDNNYNDRVMIPVTTAQERILGHDHLGYITVKAKSPEYVDEVVDAMKRVYRRYHDHGDEYNIRTGEGELEEINRVLLIMKAVAGGVAGISLIVGGIGIMNIMLVSVTERTREIGVRKALGATRSNILHQFIVEAVVLCLFGGMLGIGLGLIIGKAISIYITSITHMTFISLISPKLMMIAVGFSLSVGLIFGVYPAWRASRLDPVEALRHE